MKKKQRDGGTESKRNENVIGQKKIIIILTNIVYLYLVKKIDI